VQLSQICNYTETPHLPLTPPTDHIEYAYQLWGSGGLAQPQAFGISIPTHKQCGLSPSQPHLYNMQFQQLFSIAQPATASLPPQHENPSVDQNIEMLSLLNELNCVLNKQKQSTNSGFTSNPAQVFPNMPELVLQLLSKLQESISVGRQHLSGNDKHQLTSMATDVATFSPPNLTSLSPQANVANMLHLLPQQIHSTTSTVANVADINCFHLLSAAAMESGTLLTQRQATDSEFSSSQNEEKSSSP
jgi:hypothetical protein